MNLWRGLGTTVDDLAKSIARFEGYNVAGSIAQRNNNPGNLRAGTGQTGTDASGFAIFPDATTGYAALDHQIQLNADRGLSLDTFFGGQRDPLTGAVIPGGYPGYAPAADSNNPGQYSQTVAGWLGIDPNTPLTQVLGDTVAAMPSDSSLSADLSSSWDIPASLDLSASTGLSWPLLGGIAIGIIALGMAFRR